MIYDSDVKIKAAAIHLIFNVQEKLSVDERKNRVLKIFYEQLINTNEEIVKKMSNIYGEVF
jgi:hypothetical protein